MASVDFVLNLDAKSFVSNLQNLEKRISSFNARNKDLEIAADLKVNTKSLDSAAKVIGSMGKAAEKASRDLDKLADKKVEDVFKGKNVSVKVTLDSAASKQVETYVSKLSKGFDVPIKTVLAPTSSIRQPAVSTPSVSTSRIATSSAPSGIGAGAGAAAARAAADVELLTKSIKSSSDAAGKGRANYESFSKGVSNLSGAAKKTSSGLFGLKLSIDDIVSSALGFTAANAAVTAVQSVFDTLRAAFNFTAEVQSFEASISTLLGSAAAATRLKDSLLDFAAGTPYGFLELAGAAKQLAAVGLAEDEIVPTLRNIGNVASAVGTDLEGLTLIYQQAISKGFLDQGDLNQLAGRAVDFAGTLAKLTGSTTAEVRKLASEGKISSEVVQQVFAFLGEVQFGDALAKQSQTLSGLISTLKDNIALFGGALVSVFQPQINAILFTLGNFFDSLRSGANVFKEQVIPVFNEIIAQISGPLSQVFTLISNLVSGFNSVLNPILTAALKLAIGTIVTFIQVIGGIARFINENSAAIQVLVSALILFNIRLAASTASLLLNTIAQKSNIAAQIASATTASILAIRTAFLWAQTNIFTLSILRNNIALAANRVAQLAVSGIAALSAINFTRQAAATTLATVAQRGLAGASGLLTGALRAVAAAFIATPLGLTIALIAGLALGVKVLYERFETLRQIVGGVAEFFSGLFDVLTGSEKIGNLGDRFDKGYANASDSAQAAIKAQEQLNKRISEASSEIDKYTQKQTELQESVDEGNEKDAVRLKQTTALLQLYKELKRALNSNDLNKAKEIEAQIQAVQGGGAVSEEERRRLIKDAFDRSIRGKNLRTGGGAAGAVRVPVEIDVKFEVDFKAVETALQNIDDQIEDAIFKNVRKRSQIQRDIDLIEAPVSDSEAKRLALIAQQQNEIEDVIREGNKNIIEERRRANDQLLKLETDYQKKLEEIDKNKSATPAEKAKFRADAEINFQRSRVEIVQGSAAILSKIEEFNQIQLTEIQRTQSLERRKIQLEEEKNLIRQARDSAQEIRELNRSLLNSLNQDLVSSDFARDVISEGITQDIALIDQKTQEDIDRYRNSVESLTESINTYKKKLLELEQRGLGDTEEALSIRSDIEAGARQVEATTRLEIQAIEKANLLKLQKTIEGQKLISEVNKKEFDRRAKEIERGIELERRFQQTVESSLSSLSTSLSNILQQTNADLSSSASGSAAKAFLEGLNPVTQAFTNLSIARKEYDKRVLESNQNVIAEEAIFDQLQSQYSNTSDSIDRLTEKISGLNVQLATGQREDGTILSDEDRRSIEKERSDLQSEVEANRKVLATLKTGVDAQSEVLEAAKQRSIDEVKAANSQLSAIALEGAQAVANAAFSIVNAAQQANIQSITAALNNQRARVDEVREALLQGGEAAANYSVQQLEAEEERQRELDVLRRDEIVKQQAFTAFQLAANGAIAVAKAWATIPPPGNAVAAALTAAGVIASIIAIKAAAGSQAPQIAKEGGVLEGGRLSRGGILKGRRHSTGGILIEAEDGEAIFSRDKTSRFAPLFDAINQNQLKSLSDLKGLSSILPVPIVADGGTVKKIEQGRLLDSGSILKGLSEISGRIQSLESTMRLRREATVIIDEEGVATNADRIMRRKATVREKNSIK